ncbi:hypothetical protein ACWDCX_12730 [Streptomyces fungicidicus]|uniref:hypothetical protein n=1 Tax=Streptomyces TaxID=1883 RepID=UPI0015E76E2F|nr:MULTISPECIES: hypothetical protein [unclassified Streptomyces]WMD05598.1 hypothetical protein Q7C01_14880 [Streptomyces sp. FXY-T5]
MSPTEPAPVRKSIPQVDFDLDDLDADEERYLDFYRKVGVHEDMLVPLAEHHDAPHSYAFKLGRTRRERADVHLARTRMPTPHGLDPVHLQGGW